MVEAEEWLWQEINRQPPWLAIAHGRDGVEQQARLALCESAALFDQVRYPGVPFGAYAREKVRWTLGRLRVTTASRYRVWAAMPGLNGEDWQPDPADYRREERDPALRAWCSPDYSAQRRCLDWRSRIVLYLRAVEGLDFREVGPVMGISYERVRQIQERAVRKLAAFRNREGLRRQLAGLTNGGGQ